MTEPTLIRHPSGITTVDAEYFRPGLASVHLVERDGRAGIVDAGANSSVPLVLRALAALGLSLDAVDWIFLTHVHLDHAGGAGTLVQHLPQAKVVVHPRGAPHLIDPTRLQQATLAVYGEQAFEKLYGTLVAVPEERIIKTQDGDGLRLGPTELQVLHTPGHALHHQALFDPLTKAVFSGDAFGLSYRELDTEAGPFVVPTTTPTQFDPDQLVQSIERIVALNPESIYLTHFGRVTAIASLASSLREQVVRFVEIAQEHAEAANRQDLIRCALNDYLVARARAHGIEQAAAFVNRVLELDIQLNAQGLNAWLERREKGRRRGANPSQ